jgi:riboflavin synthase
MFTGLIEACAPVLRVERRGAGSRLHIASPGRGFALLEGQSVCVSGACLSVVTADEREVAFDISAETLARTWFDALEEGDVLNLERSLKLGDRLDGHMVSGHVDGRGRIVGIEEAGDGGSVITFEAEPHIARFLVDKGSIAVDGISLTLVAPEGPRFRVAVIPLTLERTSLGRAVEGQAVNLEADMVGKWVERLMRA